MYASLSSTGRPASAETERPAAWRASTSGNSIMPAVPRANTHLSALAVAERLADRLR